MPIALKRGIIMHIASVLGRESINSWNMKVGSDEPTLESLMEFLRERKKQALESTDEDEVEQPKCEPQQKKFKIPLLKDKPIEVHKRESRSPVAGGSGARYRSKELPVKKKTPSNQCFFVK